VGLLSAQIHPDKIRNNDMKYSSINPLNPELNPICYLLALLAHHFLHVSRIRVKSLTPRLLMSYMYDIISLRVNVKSGTSKIKKKHNFQSHKRSIHSDIYVWYTIIISAHTIIPITESSELLWFQNSRRLVYVHLQKLREVYSKGIPLVMVHRYCILHHPVSDIIMYRHVK
jgi:hypothetical protein